METIEVRKSDSGDEMFVGRLGIVQVTVFDRGVTRHTCVGQQTGAMAEKIIEVGARALDEFGSCAYMVDNWDGTMMATEFREKMTEWFAAHAPHVSAHMLLRSKMFEMGLNIANMVLRRRAAVAYSRIEAWEAMGRELSGSPEFCRQPVDIPEDLRGRFRRR